MSRLLHEGGLVPLVAVSQSPQRQAEAGIIGREGMTGISVMLGLDRCPHDTFVQKEGSAHYIATGDLRDAIGASDTLQRILLRYVHVTNVALAHTALANARGTIEQRLARWLLMVHDRGETDDIHLTHEFLSLMLGNRRGWGDDVAQRPGRKWPHRAFAGVASPFAIARD